MPKFTVHVKRVMIERWPIEVEARTLASAKRKALEEAAEESTDWDNVETESEIVMTVVNDRFETIWENLD